MFGDARQDLRAALGRGRIGFLVVGVAVGLYLLIPIAIVFPMSLTGDFFLTWPPDLFSLRWFESFFEKPVWTDALLTSIRIAVPVAVLATVIGGLAALGTAYATTGRRGLQALFIAPIVLPIITYSLGLYDISERFNLAGSTWPVIIGQTMLASPLVFMIVSAGLANRDRNLPLAASSLGAAPLSVLRCVELPLLWPSLAAALLVALAYSFDEIIVAAFLLPPGEGTLPVQLLSSTQETADPTIAAASVIVIGVAASVGAVLVIIRAAIAHRRLA